MGVLCPGSRCGRMPHRLTAEGSRLCQACRRGLAEDLASLPRLYNECAQRLCESSPRPLGDKVPARPMLGIPLNAAAAEARSAVIAVLSSWSGLVAQERSITGPARAVEALAGFLGLHVDWLAAHEAAAEASHEVARLARTARRGAYPNPPRRVALGACVEPGCAGSLTATVRPQDALLPAEISCDANSSHRWQTYEWMRLGHRMDDGQRAGTRTRWLSVENVARLWRTPAGTVYRLASEHQWRRRKQAGRTYYHEGDVEQTFAARVAH
jgi:hypothetical protein